MNLFRVRSKEFPKTDAFSTFEAIKRSPFSGGNSFARPASEKASAEMGADARLKPQQHSLERHATSRTLCE